MFIDSNVRKVFFTADTHFGHKNIIKYCNRPFANVDEMNDTMRNNWNKVVGPDDIVFHIGDFAFLKNPREMIYSLNGEIILVPGNHDDDVKLLEVMGINQTKFDIAPTLFEVDFQVEDEKLRFVLCHYALRVWNKSHHGAMHLYGHSHGTLPEDPTARSMDVGVDCHNFTPISLDGVLVHMYKKSFKPVDHHGERK
jgi:calcineurin-like phosphoesterase family protein